jgi:hypothetical protein
MAARARKDRKMDSERRESAIGREIDSDPFSGSFGFSRIVRSALRRERIVIALLGSENCRFDVKVDYLVELRRASQGAFGRFASFTSALTFPSMQRQFWRHSRRQPRISPAIQQHARVTFLRVTRGNADSTPRHFIDSLRTRILLTDRKFVARFAYPYETGNRRRVRRERAKRTFATTLGIA